MANGKFSYTENLHVMDCLTFQMEKNSVPNFIIRNRPIGYIQMRRQNDTIILNTELSVSVSFQLLD